jgi:hypothetical protein
VEHRWNDRHMKHEEFGQEKRVPAPIVHTNTSVTGLGSNPGLCYDRPETIEFNSIRHIWYSALRATKLWT